MEANCIIYCAPNVNPCSLSPEEYQEREELLKLRQSSLKKVRGVAVGMVFKLSCRKSSSYKLKWRL